MRLRPCMRSSTSLLSSTPPPLPRADQSTMTVRPKKYFVSLERTACTTLVAHNDKTTTSLKKRLTRTRVNTFNPNRRTRYVALYCVNTPAQKAIAVVEQELRQQWRGPAGTTSPTRATSRSRHGTDSFDLPGITLIHSTSQLSHTSPPPPPPPLQANRLPVTAQPNQPHHPANTSPGRYSLLILPGGASIKARITHVRALLCRASAASAASWQPERKG